METYFSAKYSCMCVIPALERLRQEDQEFEASLSFIVRSSIKKERREGAGEREERKEEINLYFPVLEVEKSKVKALEDSLSD
jgi:hypothetical protein